MPLRTEIFHAFYGVWRLLILDRRGMDWFNLSVTGFWRSFLAGVIVAPAYFATITVGDQGDVAPDGLMVMRALQYLAGWIAFPLVMIAVASLMGWTDRYVSYVVAYNWSSVIMIAVMLPMSVIADAVRPEPPSLTLADTFYYIAFMFSLFYSWFVAHTALRIESFTAVAIVLLDLIIGFIIGAGGMALLQNTGSNALPL